MTFVGLGLILMAGLFVLGITVTYFGMRLADRLFFRQKGAEKADQPDSDGG